MSTRTANTQAMTMAGLNLIQQALSIYDSDLRLVVANDRFRSMFDLPDALITPGASFEDTIRFLTLRGEYGNVEDPEHFIKERVDLALAFEPHYVERQMGNGRWISIEGSPLPQGGWVAVYTDISSSKRQEELLRTRSETLSDQLLTRAEELAATNRALASTVTALEETKRQLTEMEARIRLTAEMIPAHIAHIGPDFSYTYSNRKLDRVMPGSATDPVGLHAAKALGDATWAVLDPYVQLAIAGQPSVFEFNHDPSTHRVRVALTPDESTGGVYILSMDITEETQSRAALQQTRRREIATQMMSGLAHDFSNLLTIVLGSQSRLQRTDLPDSAQELVSATLAAARRGGALLNRISSMTGRRSMHPLPTHVATFLTEFETLAKSALPENLKLRIDNQFSNETLLLDVGPLQDSLLNLVLNARDACADHGDIKLSIKPVKETWIEIAVSDTGPGFSEDALAHAFDPFYTTKGEGGSGLGLAMVYDIAKLSGGSARARNTHEGALVSIRLPLRHAPEPVKPGLTLLVEDSSEIRANVREVLVELGHSVIEAVSVDEALALAREVPDISLVLSDISLEGSETGVDLISALPAPKPSCLLMTSLPENHLLFQKAVSVAPVLRKPFTPQTLASYLGTDTSK